MYFIVGKTRKNAYLVLQPSHSIESFVDDQDVNPPVATSNYLPCDKAEMGQHKTIPLSKSQDDFPLIEFTMSVSVQKSVNKPSTPVCIETKETATTNDGPLVGKPHSFMKSGSVPCKPLKSSVSADNVKYFSATPEINFIKISDNHEKSNPYKFEAKSTRYPKSVSAHQGLKSSYQLGSSCNLLTSNINSSSTQSHSKDHHGENGSVDNQNAFKFTHGGSSLKKSTSHPVICNYADTHKNGTGNSTRQPNLRGFKSSSLSPSKITGNTTDIGNVTKPRNNGNCGMQFEFSEPAVVQPVAACVLEVDSPQQYSDIEKDPECSEIYSMDEIHVSYMESQDVRKQLFADAENDHGVAFPDQKEVEGGNKDDGLFGSPLKNPETSALKSSGLLEEISSDLAEKHRYVIVILSSKCQGIILFRYSPNYVMPLTAVQSTEYDNDEILDYTRSPHHCVATSRVVVNDSKWQDDSQQSRLESLMFHAQRSPDPWAARKQTHNFSSREHIYKVTEEGTSRHTDFDEAVSSEQRFSHVTTSKAGSTTCDNQSSTSTTTTVSATKFSMG